MKNRLGSVIKIKSNLLRDNAERPTAAHSGNFQTEKKRPHIRSDHRIGFKLSFFL